MYDARLHERERMLVVYQTFLPHYYQHNDFSSGAASSTEREREKSIHKFLFLYVCIFYCSPCIIHHHHLLIMLESKREKTIYDLQSIKHYYELNLLKRKN